jgi:hypothetical protein
MIGLEQPRIACCLSGGDYQRRVAWIERLTSEALRSSARDDPVLPLLYAPEAAGEVQKMVEQERICCAFLTFDLDERADAVCVTITAPEAARDSADILFGQFLAGRRAHPIGSGAV